MSSNWKKTLLIAGAFTGLSTALKVYSQLRYHRSLSATLVEGALRLFVKDKRTGLQVKQDLAHKKMVGEKTYHIPEQMHFLVAIKKTKFNNIDIYELNPERNSGTAILYLHGGAYAAHPTIQHWKMLNKLAQRTNARIIVPIYTVIPFATYHRAYQTLTALYQLLKNDDRVRKIILMGDSAGGGMALGLAESFAVKDLPQPDSLILLSPWVDITLSNPETKKLDTIDPILNRQALIANGQLWAGKTDRKDYHLSPLFGDVAPLKNVTIFVGTREEFYPDILKLNKKLKKHGVVTNLFHGIGQNHIYPILPTWEARNAIQQMIAVIFSV
ncbi:hypothetical protein FD51_GL001473 [Lacticaseibacillus zeae DSM 20178 = KCTC 3804]|uniref:Alpha/beta hydrolase n=2 Tax=Lacticaseibacillus zeae TaxID=57037 RepID=A0A5R8M013_LACZE|nr:alpha/beta hydrolase [Lacticaseibacillus zeae]KRK13270.1 hypothetical protein FD51_GL001473 [Lacticaseibacillus zeae DSM 20178 = KCTC 3804]OLS06789.1 esterase [Lacticaseibacillus casei]QVI32103.1 alpha/beta hydrolase [Lacticaseibacillus zeae]TLF41339.1 alpha/beta hydrolase [Lacticaseibacillus zeae]